jgi:regulator of sigma E protease
MIIISAGVVMNLFLAFVCFMFVFMTRGMNEVPGIVGGVEPGGPAWKKGLRPGDVVKRIGNAENPHYNRLKRTVMWNGNEHPLPLIYERFTDGKPQRFETEITPLRSGDVLAPMLLMGAPSTTTMIDKAAKLDGPVAPTSAASRATPPFQFGDRVIAMTDPDNPSQVTPLRIDPRQPNTEETDYFELMHRMQWLVDKPITIRVQRVDGSTADIRVEPEYARSLGVRFRMGPIVATRDGSPAAAAGVQVRQGNIDGDVIEAVEVTRPDGKPLRYSAAIKDGDEPLDPLRLPTQLALWAISKPKDFTVKITVQHSEGHNHESKILSMKWDSTWELFDNPPQIADFPLTIAPLGLGYLVQNTVAGTDPNSPAAATALKDGDQGTGIEYKVETSTGKEVTQNLDVKENQVATLFSVLADVDGLKEVTLKLGNKTTVSLAPAANGGWPEDRSWPLVNRGFLFKAEKRLIKADGFVDALARSADQELFTVGSIYENLMGLLGGRLSVRAVAGPVTIVTTAFDLAGQNIFEFIIFIAVINVNLAVVNFLPIPVLDGGHMVFLGYELLRGKPPSERWRLILTIMGLVVVLGLMVLGLALDAQRNDILGWLMRHLGL